MQKLEVTINRQNAGISKFKKPGRTENFWSKTKDMFGEKFHTHIPKKLYLISNHPPSEITKMSYRNCSND